MEIDLKKASYIIIAIVLFFAIKTYIATPVHTKITEQKSKIETVDFTTSIKTVDFTTS